MTELRRRLMSTAPFSSASSRAGQFLHFGKREVILQAPQQSLPPQIPPYASIALSSGMILMILWTISKWNFSDGASQKFELA